MIDLRILCISISLLVVFSYSTFSSEAENWRVSAGVSGGILLGEYKVSTNYEKSGEGWSETGEVSTAFESLKPLVGVSISLERRIGKQEKFGGIFQYDREIDGKFYILSAIGHVAKVLDEGVDLRLHLGGGVAYVKAGDFRQRYWHGSVDISDISPVLVSGLSIRIYRQVRLIYMFRYELDHGMLLTMSINLEGRVDK